MCADVYAALLDHPLGGLVRLPLGLFDFVAGLAVQRQAVGLFDVEHGVAAHQRRARVFLLGLALGRTLTVMEVSAPSRAEPSARMRAGLRASNRRARHLPMRYETGLPSSVIRFRT